MASSPITSWQLMGRDMETVTSFIFLDSKIPADGDYSHKMKVLVSQSCLTLCDPMDWSPPGSPVHGILQARTLEWVAIPFSRGSSRPGNQTRVFCSVGTC